jgi:putative DNA methylase
MLDASPTVPSLTPLEAPYKKKLIEVALPLQAINAASAREKSIRHGHPSTLHLWWARRPLAACRAVLFASLVDDPSSHPERFPTSEDQERERKRLFDLIEQLVQWENSLNEDVLTQARKEIRQSVGDDLPTLYDPFCGGGAIPIEAQRLGLPTLASDLNPVAVLITKALTEIPWRFKGYVPVHPSLRGPLYERTWERATGLAADVGAYGKWMLAEARKRVGSLYPSARLADGREGTVIAWLWARTVRCPNPLCGALMPLIKSFVLSAKKGKECCLVPIVDRHNKTVRYETREGRPDRDGTVSRRGAICIVCNEPVDLSYIRSEGKSGRIGVQMIAIVADGPRGREYLPPSEEQRRIAISAKPAWAPDTSLPERALGFRVQAYGMTKHRDLFTQRQLVALTTFSDLVREGRERALADAIAAGLENDSKSLSSGGSAATAYADAIATYLALTVDRLADYHSALCSWHATGEKIRNVFARQTLSMIWDFAEANPLSESTGSFDGAINWVKKATEAASARTETTVFQRDAAGDWQANAIVVATDPPYYDNVPYADLSDFFYVWLRASLSEVYPELLSTILVPKAQELVADPARFRGDAKMARHFFEDGLRKAFSLISRSASQGIPIAAFYAFKQADEDAENVAATLTDSRASEGWETMLEALFQASLQIDGSWPMRSELANRMRGQNSNALASSIVLVCRPRPVNAARCTRSDFLRALQSELPLAVKYLRDASLPAADLEQAAIGPGMSIFSRYREVLENDGSAMAVRSALSLINRELAQILLGEISDADPGTHFAITWFDGHFYDAGKFGEAEVLLKAKNANLDSLREAGVIDAQRGVVRLIAPRNIAVDGDPIAGGAIRSMPMWAQMMYLMRFLVGDDGSEETTADALRAMGPMASESLKGIAYLCYLVCERAKRSSEAQDFNALVAAWPELTRLANQRTDPSLF